MPHRHHPQCCPHETLQYCAVCRKVYCTQCDREWSDPPFWWTSPYTYTYTSVPLGTTLTAGATDVPGTTTSTADPPPHEHVVFHDSGRS